MAWKFLLLGLNEFAIAVVVANRRITASYLSCNLNLFCLFHCEVKVCVCVCLVDCFVVVSGNAIRPHNLSPKSVHIFIHYCFKYSIVTAIALSPYTVCINDTQNNLQSPNDFLGCGATFWHPRNQKNLEQMLVKWKKWLGAIKVSASLDVSLTERGHFDNAKIAFRSKSKTNWQKRQCSSVCIGETFGGQFRRYSLVYGQWYMARRLLPAMTPEAISCMS